MADGGRGARTTHLTPPARPTHSSAEVLDSASDDAPAAVAWAVRTSASDGDGGVCVTARSLLWPGYFFRADVDSPSFSGMYWGDGIANTALCFMV